MNMEQENELLARITAENPGRRSEKVAGSRWGRLILPAPAESAQRPQKGMKILCVGSWTMGLLTLEALLAMERELPGKVQIIGLVTDDPLDSDAKISVKRRFWRYYPEKQQEEYEWGLLHRALEMGLTCYTGEVKCDAFREMLADWAPDAIIMAAFGQAIDEPILAIPPFGMYNFHPSDLLHGHGAGPQPWEDLVSRGASSSRMTLHRVSTEIDGGEIVGQSPEINIRLADGSPSNDVLLIGEKNLVPMETMVQVLVRTLLERKAAGETGPVSFIDFEGILDQKLKERLKAPLDFSQRGEVLPLPRSEKTYTV